MHLANFGYVIGALVVAAALYVVFYYNRLVRARNMMQEGWSGIDVQLRRRADLVPILIQTVKGYAPHEHGIFEDLADSGPEPGRQYGDRPDRGGAGDARRARAPLRGRRGLSGVEGGRQFPTAADRARTDRKPGAAGAALLQRRGARVEHARPVLSRQPGRRAVRLHPGELFRAGR